MTDRIRYILLSACLLALFACSKEGSPADADRLYIRAVSADFSQDALPATKTANTGYLTSFVAGDEIGVTGIDKDGNILADCNNVKFTYHEDSVESGVVWSSFLNERDYGFVERVEGAKYFAYYPYDPKWDDCTLEHIVSNFAVEEDQRTIDAFDRSDLMAPDEALAPSGGELRFVMKHKMATISLFYNSEWQPDGVTPLYPITLLSGTTPSGLTKDHTFRAPLDGGRPELRRRYLVNPATTPEVKLVGRLEEKSYRYFSKTIQVQPGYLYSVSF